MKMFKKCPRCQTSKSRFESKKLLKIRVSGVFDGQDDEFLSYENIKVCTKCCWELRNQQSEVLMTDAFNFYTKVKIAERRGLKCGICGLKFSFDPDGVLCHAYFEHGVDEAEQYSHDQIVQLA